MVPQVGKYGGAAAQVHHWYWSFYKIVSLEIFLFPFPTKIFWPVQKYLLSGWQAADNETRGPLPRAAAAAAAGQTTATAVLGRLQQRSAGLVPPAGQAEGLLAMTLPLVYLPKICSNN